ncbi:hypothetical protein ACIBCO_33145 [Streptomyces violascens]|uniref:hypothetical protein n=1 Tax=Streptomyces violascens TaxID=67381 RepID=UPI00379DE587
MRRCVIAAIALGGALAVSSAAPAFAAVHTPVVSAVGAPREATDRRPGDDPKDDVKTELAQMKKELGQLVADAKQDAGRDAADTKKEAAKDAADAKKEAAALLNGNASLVKDAMQQAKPSFGA